MIAPAEGQCQPSDRKTHGPIHIRVNHVTGRTCSCSGCTRVKIRASVSLNLLDRVVDIHGGAISYVLAVLAKAIAIREKTHRMLHAKKFATHRRDRIAKVHIVFWHMSIALLTDFSTMLY
jgi:hypothetical protein